MRTVTSRHDRPAGSALAHDPRPPRPAVAAAALDATRATEPTHLETLVYELLDAHADTVLMADQFTDDPHWSAHLDYLRALQREGRALLSQLVLDQAA